MPELLQVWLADHPHQKHLGSNVQLPGSISKPRVNHGGSNQEFKSFFVP